MALTHPTQARVSESRPAAAPADAARDYAAHGWAVFPCHTPTRDEAQGGALVCSCHKGARCTNVGKHPRWQRGILEHGFHDASKSAAVIAEWWRLWPRANPAIATGAVSGLIVLDIDRARGGVCSLGELQGHQLPQLPPTRTVLTGGGGYHRFFRHPGAGVEIAGGSDVFGEHLPGLDLRADGGYIVAPPSLHQSGKSYAWAPGTEELAIAELPEAWLRYLIARTERMRQTSTNGGARETNRRDRASNGRDRGKAAQHWLEHYTAQARDGNRNEVGMRLAEQLRDTAQLDETAAEDVLLEYAARVTGLGRLPYGDDEARATVRSIYRRVPRPPAVSARWRGRGASSAGAPAPADVREYPSDMEADHWHEEPPAPGEPDEPEHRPEPPHARYKRTELGNTERLLDQHGADIRYCKALGWCVWDGVRWRADDELGVRRMAKATVRAMYREAAELGAAAGASEQDVQREQLAGEAKMLFDWAIKSERERMIAAMVSLARDACEVEPRVFDRDPWLLNCANGILDLRTGQLGPHRREAYLMRLAPVDYNLAAQAPLFGRFIRQIMCEREELVEYLQRFFGYCLSGSVREQVWHLLVGPSGENGKSTLIDTIAAILGSYAETLEPESLTITAGARDANAPSPDIAKLAGARFVAVTETEQGARLATARLKKLTGGDVLTGRFMRRDPFSFRPEFKLVVYTNHKPRAQETVNAFWRRVRYIPFEWSVKDHPGVKDENLKDKLLGEASGILAWMVRGALVWQRDGLTAPAVVEAATQAYQTDQDTLGAFLRDCCVTTPQQSVTLGALYEAYTHWCDEGGESPQTKRRFNQALAERGFEQSRSNVARLWLGIGLPGRESQGTLLERSGQ